MPTSSMDQRHSVRSKVKGVIKQIRKEKDQFTAADITKRCNLPSRISTGQMLGLLAEDFGYHRVRDGEYAFA